MRHLNAWGSRQRGRRSVDSSKCSVALLCGAQHVQAVVRNTSKGSPDLPKGPVIKDATTSATGLLATVRECDSNDKHLPTQQQQRPARTLHSVGWTYSNGLGNRRGMRSNNWNTLKVAGGHSSHSPYFWCPLTGPK